MMIFDVLVDVSIYVLIGAVAGLLAGILGLGGGLLVVPGLLYVFNHDPLMPSDISMQLATATSLAIMMVTSLAAVRAHYRQGDILWAVYKRFWPGLVAGACLGVSVAAFLASEWLQRLFGLFLLLVAWKLFMEKGNRYKSPVNKPWLDRMISLIVGLFSGLLGIGGGTLVVPYLIHTGVPIRKTAPVAGLCSMTVAIAGTAAVTIAGYSRPDLPAYSTGFVYWPAVLWVVLPACLFAPLGVHLTYALPARYLKMVFILLAVVMAVVMLI